MNLHEPHSRLRWIPFRRGGIVPRATCPAPASSPHDSGDGVLARLEWLDDLMFAAIDADPSALERASDAWQRAIDDLGAETLEESRQQYLRHARTTWEQLRKQKEQPPHRIFAAIEVISILAERTW